MPQIRKSFEKLFEITRKREIAPASFSEGLWSWRMQKSAISVSAEFVLVGRCLRYLRLG